MHVFLKVPDNDISLVKELGASFDVLRRSWYILDSHKNINILKKWEIQKELEFPAKIEKKFLDLHPKGIILDINSNFPNENRSFGQGLFVDLVPKSCWFSNVRSCISPANWQRVRKVVVQRAENHCEVCGVKPNNAIRLYMEVHERWDYSQENGVNTQTLKRLICLCSNCHLVTHIGFANITGRLEKAIKHLMIVNKISEDEALMEINRAHFVWENRNKTQWKLDISVITSAGISIKIGLNS